MNIIKLKVISLKAIDSKIGVSGIVTTGESDLSNYYTKKEIDDKNFLTEHQDISNKLDKEEASHTYLLKGNYLTEHQSLEEYAKKSEVPTKTSLLINDSNFISEHQDISTLATKEELNTKADKEHTHSLYLTEHLSLVGYAKNSEIPSKVSQLANDKNYLTQHQSLIGYAKENWVKNEIANASLQGGDVDLSGLATKEELTLKLDTSIYNQDKLNFATKDEIPSLDGYLKEVPAEYVTETELNDKNYLTLHQDISGKLDKTEAVTLYQKKGNYLESIPEEYVTSTELAQEGFLKEHQSLIGYAKETWVTQKIADAQLSGGEVDLTPYATKEELKGYLPKGNYLTSVPSEYVTESELNLKGYLTEHQDISGKLDKLTYNVDKPTFALKTELPKDYLTAKDIENKADKSEIPSITGLATKSEISDMETKTNAKLLYQPKGNYLTQHQSLTNYALKSEIKTKTSELTNDSNFISSIPTEYVTETELNQKNYLTKHQSIKTIGGKSLIGSGNIYLDGTDVEVEYYEDIERTFLRNYGLNEFAQVVSDDINNLNSGKQDKLVSGTNIKTINGQSLLGKGEIDISDTTIENNLTSDNPFAALGATQGKILKDLIDEKQPKGNYLTSVPAEYVTETELTLKGYLTSASNIAANKITQDTTHRFVTDAEKTEWNKKSDKIQAINGGKGDVTKELKPNTFYKFGVCSSLSITLAPEISGIYNSYSFEFKSGNIATNLTLPSSIKWISGKTVKINGNKTYQISIVNNLAVWGEF